VGSLAISSTPAAAAAAPGFIATPNGMVGVTQTITINAPSAVGQTVTIGLQFGAVVQVLQTVIGSNGFGAANWTPAAAGTWTISAQGTIQSAGSTSITVVPMPTYTVLLAQDALQQSASNTLLAAVVAPIGTLAPTGSVALMTSGGAALASGPLTGQFGTSTSTAQIPWTPSAGGPTSIQATYQPASGGQQASTSPVSNPNVIAGVTALAVRWPANLYVGTSTTLQAVLGAGYPEGTVAFLVDGTGISGSIPTVNGVASFQWSPPSSGVHTISAQYTGSRPGFSGSVAQTVNVQGARAADNITVNPPTQPVWSVAQPIVMKAGTTATLVGTSASGTTVLFSEQGPCVIAGATLRALGVGQCQVTAFTPGNATLTPGSETYTVTVQRPPKRPR
jgi:hypothetical protein